MKKNLVIIPVRGGSKRLPQKNIRLLGDIPLLVHSIKYAKEFPEICHDIVISTDDPDIKEIALKEGVIVIDRPKELSGDLTTTVEVLKHVVSVLSRDYNAVILLQATNPLRPEKLLEKAYLEFTKGEYESLVTVTENRQKFGKIINQKFVPYNYEFGQRSQDMEPLYFENGLLYISKYELIKKGKILGEKNLPFIVNHVFSSIDIDEEEDFELANYYYNKYKK